MVRKLPEDGAIIFKRKFALFPTCTTDNYWVWLSWVVVKYKWFAYNKKWLYQGTQLLLTEEEKI